MSFQDMVRSMHERRRKEAPAPVPPLAVEPEPRVEVFDPRQHTVTETVAHMEQHADQIEAIKELEAQGRGRTGILGYEPF